MRTSSKRANLNQKFATQLGLNAQAAMVHLLITRAQLWLGCCYKAADPAIPAANKSKNFQSLAKGPGRMRAGSVFEHSSIVQP
jgi:hypothetical protein